MAGRYRAGLAVLGAVALVLTLAAPASADDVPAPDWTPAPCATGEITEVSPDVDEYGEPTVRIAGWIQPCAGTEVTNGFAVIRYFPEGGVRSGLVPYESMSAPTSFALQVGGLRRTLLPGVTAFCVAYAYVGRVACVGVDVRGPGQPPGAEPISTDDRRVLVGLRWGPVRPDGPTCGTCV